MAYRGLRVYPYQLNRSCRTQRNRSRTLLQPSSSRATDALTLVRENEEFQRIINSHDYNTLKRRRDIVRSVQNCHSTLFSHFCSLPPVLKPIISSTTRAVSSALGEHCIAELLRVYSEGELDFFATFLHIGDDEFLNCVYEVKDDVEANHELAIDNSVCATSSLPRECTPTPGTIQGAGLNNSLTHQRIIRNPQLYPNLDAQSSPLHPSSDNNIHSYPGQPSGYHIVSHGAAYHHNPTESNESPSLATEQSPPRNSAQTPGATIPRYLCTNCPKSYGESSRGLRRWIEHQLLEHNEKMSWTCGHADCRGSGKKEISFIDHHKKRHEECLADACPFKQVSITQRGRVAGVCLKCDQDVFTGSECARDLYTHYATEHKNVLLTGSLDITQGDYSKDMRRLFKARRELWSRYNGCVSFDDLHFDSTNSDVQKLREELELNPFQDNSAADTFIQTFLFYGASYPGTVSQDALQHPPTSNSTYTTELLSDANSQLLCQTWSPEIGQNSLASFTTPMFHYATDTPARIQNGAIMPYWRPQTDQGSDSNMQP